MPPDPAKPPKPPIYTSAFICASLLTDKESILSAIRIADIFTAPSMDVAVTCPHGSSQTIHVYPPVHVAAVLIFRSEEPVDFAMRFQGMDANGEILPGVYNVPITIGIGFRTSILNVALQIDPRHVGDLWFEIYIDDELATKFPFRIIHEKPRDTQPSGQESTEENPLTSDLAE